MKIQDKAEIILEELIEFTGIELDEESKKWYLHGIKNGLVTIEINRMKERERKLESEE